jgi:hypothetical protein
MPRRSGRRPPDKLGGPTTLHSHSPADVVTYRELTNAFDDRLDRARRRRLFEHKRPPAVLVHREQIVKRAVNIYAHAKRTIHAAATRIRAVPSHVQDADIIWVAPIETVGGAGATADGDDPPLHGPVRYVQEVTSVSRMSDNCNSSTTR